MEKDIYETEKRAVSSSESSAFIKKLKEEKPFLKEVHSKALQQSIIDLNAAYNNFFRGLKTNKFVGFPKFKKKKNYNDSCRYPIDAFIGVKGNRISFTKALNDIHFKCSRRDKKYLNKRKDFVRSSTIRRTSTNKYYASILIEYDCEKLSKKVITNEEELSRMTVGIDMGVKSFLVTSDGEVFDSEKYQKLEKEIKKYQRQLSKTEPDSKRHHKIRVKLAKKHEKIKNKRNWHHHHVSNSLLNENQVIVVEDLNVKGMIKNHNLAKSIQNQSFSIFFEMLKYKCEWYGKDLVEVGRFFASSKTCSKCGYKKEDLTLNDREWTCPQCGSHNDRDYNAALNIKQEGLRKYKEKIVGLSSPEFTHEDCPLVDDRCASNLKSKGRNAYQSRDVKIMYLNEIH